MSIKTGLFFLSDFLLYYYSGIDVINHYFIKEMLNKIEKNNKVLLLQCVFVYILCKKNINF